MKLVIIAQGDGHKWHRCRSVAYNTLVFVQCTYGIASMPTPWMFSESPCSSHFICISRCIPLGKMVSSGGKCNCFPVPGVGHHYPVQRYTCLKALGCGSPAPSLHLAQRFGGLHSYTIAKQAHLCACDPYHLEQSWNSLMCHYHKFQGSRTVHWH
jgi:hypothetical protein